MSIIAVLLMQAAPALPPQTICQMANPAGDVLTFRLTIRSDEAGETALLMPRDGTIWPRREISLVEAPTMSLWGGVNVKTHAFSIGTGDNPNQLIVTDHGHAFVFHTHERRLTVPLASGFCDEAAVEVGTSEQSATSSVSGNPFAVSRWTPNACHALSRSGQRSTILYDLLENGEIARITVQDRNIWSGGPYRLNVRNGRGNMSRLVNSRNGRGPEGSDTFALAGQVGVRLLNFTSLGPESIIGEHETVAMCGYQGVTARPVVQ